MPSFTRDSDIRKLEGSRGPEKPARGEAAPQYLRDKLALPQDFSRTTWLAKAGPSRKIYGWKLKNKFGLDRNIPSEVKRLVRQRDGFGCILCGNAIIDYEHLEPEFRDAKIHNPDCIVLLCVGCHNRKTRNRISKDKIEAARKSPRSKISGFSFDSFDVGDRHPTVVIGNTLIEQTPDILQIGNDVLLRAAPPEEAGAPFRIGASLNDSNGNTSLLIVDNEWRAMTRNWDVECIGNATTIRSNFRSIDIKFRTIPPNHLIFENISLLHRGVKVEAKIKHPTKFTLADGSVLKTNSSRITKCQAGIVVENNSVSLGRRGGSFSTLESGYIETYISSILKSQDIDVDNKENANIVQFPGPKR